MRSRWDEEKSQDFLVSIQSDRFLENLKSAEVLVEIDVNEALKLFNEGLREAADCMKVNTKRVSTIASAWFDNECLSKKRSSRRLLRKYRKLNTEETKADYMKERKAYKKLVREKQHQYKQNQVDKLLSSMDNPKDFWKEIKKHNRKKMHSDEISKDKWFQHFKNILNSDVENEILDSIPAQEETTSNEILDSKIGEHEIQKALRRLKAGKSAGFDGILNEMLRTSESAILPFLTKLFNALFEKGIYPVEWTKSIIIPLHKKGNHDSPDNFRGISLTNTLSKVFAIVLNNRLNKWAEENDIIDECQAGFRKGYSTVDHIFTLHACIQKQFSKNAKLYVAFIDFCKAYDTVQRHILWPVLFQIGIRGRLYKILKSMYVSVKASVRCANEYTDFFECLQGLKQGCVLSPVLFSFLINELAHDIIENGKHGIRLSPSQLELFLMLFADDILLMSYSITGLQNQLNILYNCTKKLHLKINLSKSKIMIFRKGGHIASREKWFLGTDKLEIVNSYKYLGITFSTKMSWHLSVDEIATRAKKAIFEISKVLNNMKCYSAKIFFKLFDTQVAPILLYGAEVWGHTKLESIEKVHLLACKKFLKVSMRTPNSMIYGELGRFPLFINSAASCIRYWFKLLKQPESRYSKCAYNMLYHMASKGNSNWVSHVKHLLCCNGFAYVWMYGSVGDEKAFIRTFKERLRDCYCQDWFSCISSSGRFELYSSHKLCFEKEKYIESVHVSIYRCALARFRLGVTDINCHRNRYAAQQEQKHCPFCKNHLENEIHILFICPIYKELREQYFTFNRWYSSDIPLQHQLVFLLKSQNENLIFHLSKYVFLILQKRSESMTCQAS